MFARGEPRGEPGAGDLDRHVMARPEPHLDPLVLVVPMRDMLERVDVEVRAEASVDDAQHVPVERGGDPGRVVVGPDEHFRVLHQIRAQQQPLPLVQDVPHRPEEHRALGGQEVPDRAAEEGDDPGLPAGQEFEVLREVADDPAYLEARVVRRDRLGGVGQCRLRDVQRDKGFQAAVAGQRVQQQPRLLARAGTQLDEGVRIRERRDIRGVRGEDFPLGAGRVVLGQLGDLLEQLAAFGVVEPLGRQPLPLRGEPGDDVRAQFAGYVVAGPVVVEIDFGHRGLALLR